MQRNWNAIDQDARKAIWDASTNPIFKVLVPFGRSLKPIWRNRAQVREVEGIWMYWGRQEGFQVMTTEEMKSLILEPPKGKQSPLDFQIDPLPSFHSLLRGGIMRKGAPRRQQ